MALRCSSSDLKDTLPKHLDSPVSLFVTTLASTTSPQCAKCLERSCAVVPLWRPATKTEKYSPRFTPSRTSIGLPCNSLPLNSFSAFSLASCVLNTTNPLPYDVRVSRSRKIETLSTSPASAKNSAKASSSTSWLTPVTKTVGPRSRLFPCASRMLAPLSWEPFNSSAALLAESSSWNSTTPKPKGFPFSRSRIIFAPLQPNSAK
mmetsp:Transcript_124976/g.365032  ORF Transcript_124976/g.365032 Transcript_124976/m.365032 type:complete len:205 (+) Transcript_124976:407-1021(+)